FSFRVSACCVSAINSERVADHEACKRTAQPSNGSRDLLWSAKPPHRLVSLKVFHRERFLGDHISNHGRLDGSRTYGIDANASGGIFERRTLRQADHSMLGCMVDGTAREADQATNGRAVDDGTASMLANLAQLILHAVTDSAQIVSVTAHIFFAA